MTFFGASKSNTSFNFNFSILIPSSPITTSRNSTFLAFYLHFPSFIFKLFSGNLFTTSSTTSSYSSSFSIPTIILSMKLATSLVLIKFYKILFIIVWNVARELVSSKNITIDLIISLPYLMENTNIPIILDVVEKILKSNYIFNNISIASQSRIIKVSPKLDMAII